MDQLPSIRKCPLESSDKTTTYGIYFDTRDQRYRPDLENLQCVACVCENSLKKPAAPRCPGNLLARGTRATRVIRSNPQQAASAVGASNKSRSGALDARHYASTVTAQRDLSSTALLRSVCRGLCPGTAITCPWGCSSDVTDRRVFSHGRVSMYDAVSNVGSQPAEAAEPGFNKNNAEPACTHSHDAVCTHVSSVRFQPP